MTNIVIESTSTKIEIYLNDYSTQIGMVEEIIPKTSVTKLSKTTNGITYFVAKAGTTYSVSADGVGGTLIVDSVNDVAVVDNDDLFTKIESIL